MGKVVPLAGTWIEIIWNNSICVKLYYVVPLAGTWIEIDDFKFLDDQRVCRSPRGNVD